MLSRSIILASTLNVVLDDQSMSGANFCKVTQSEGWSIHVVTRRSDGYFGRDGGDWRPVVSVAEMASMGDCCLTIFYIS
jgi:hypothetical protein